MRLQCGKFKTSACCGGQAGCKWKPDHNGTCTGGAAPSCSGWWGGSKIVPKDDDGNDCSCDSENACLEQIDCHGWGVFVEVVLFVFSFAGLAIVCDDHLVVSLETLCVRWEVREDIAGASFMAFGSAAPEIIVNIVSTVKAASKLLKVGKDSPGYQQALNEAGADTSLGVSAILGSGIIAFSLIPGMCGLFAGQTLFLKRRPLARDVGTYSLSLLMLVLFIHDGEIERYEAALMFSVYIGYIILLSTAPKCRKQYKEQKAVSPASLYERFMDEEDDMGAPKIKRKKSFVLEVQAEMQEQADKETQQMVEDRFSEDEIFDMRRAFALFDTGDGKVARADIWRVLQVLGEEKHSAEDGEAMISCVELADEFSVEFMEFCGAMVKREETESLFDKVLETVFMPLHLAFKYTCPPCEYGGPWENWYPVTFLVAFTWVSFFSYMVGAVVTRWVALLEAPIAFFGLAVVAIGAEIPDTIQSVTVAKKGYGSMAVSNGLGSQICNINIGLGSLHCRCAQCGAYRC
jgi:Ca2+/Na+ antiporter